jgi:hypothetical protein
MALTQRDKAIIKDLNKFNVMDRDSIAEIHFNNLKNPIKTANSVLLRLLREDKIQRTSDTVPFCYFGPDVTMKKDSSKIGHYLAIVDVYKEIVRRYGSVEEFQVEPKYGEKGTVEPDVFCIFKKTPMFIEVQNSVYNEKRMTEKIERYEELYQRGTISNETWQNPNNPLFPVILILSTTRYAIPKGMPFKVLQADTIAQFFDRLQKKPPSTKPDSGVQRRIGGGI